jgi:hypothetical protein
MPLAEQPRTIKFQMYELYKNKGTFRENTREAFGCVTEQTQECSLLAGRTSYIEERSIVHWTS